VAIGAMLVAAVNVPPTRSTRATVRRRHRGARL